MSVIKTAHVAVVTDHTARSRKFWFSLKSLVSVQCFINLTRNMLIAEPRKADSNGQKWEDREKNRVMKTSEKRNSEIEPQSRYYLQCLRTIYLFTCFFCRYLQSIAYREFSRLVYGFMGKKRIPLPSCAYNAIRTAFALQEDETFTGFELEDH